jgi:flagellar protein FliO/FliZ
MVRADINRVEQFRRWAVPVLALVPYAAQATTPGVAPEPIAAGNLLQLIFGLIIVIGAILATGILLRRVGRISSPIPGALRVLGGISVGARERVILVQVGDQQLLLGVAPGRVQTLHVLPQPVVEGTAASSGEKFAERLAKLVQRGPQR